MDGVPPVTQDPIQPGESFTYEFTARTPGSHLYNSHHNATDQVGRGLLGAFIVEPKDPAQRYDRLHSATQDSIWISNDALGGFTINGRGFPGTSPIVATLGETIVIRFIRSDLRRSRATRSGSIPVSAGTSSSGARSPGHGHSNATSSSTRKGRMGCSGW